MSLGITRHAESVSVTYDPAQMTYGQILKVFFAVAAADIKQLDAAHVFSRRIVTTVVPLDGFYPSEAYHRHFLDRHPDYPYIVTTTCRS